MLKNLIYIGIVAAFVSSCVPARQFEETKSKYDKCETERNALSAEKEDLEKKYNELSSTSSMLDKENGSLKKDTTVMGTSLRKMQMQYDKINKLNDELLRKQSQLQQNGEAENRKLMTELQALQLDLQKEQDELKKLEKELNAKSTNLDKLSSDLQDREKKVKELQDIINQKDEAANALKDKIANALLGYKDKGLTVEQRNGKIYVSMEAKLLFAKGSTVVDASGKKALIDLAKAIEDQTDLSIMVEGHTDTDKLAGSGSMKDNWDLSVLRSTAVTRILMENSKIDPKRITPAGKGEYVPVDSGTTEDAKAKNRRIEIVLTPDLEKIFQLLENN